MFNKVIIDILFNLLLVFVALFFLSFVLINDPQKKKNNEAQNSNDVIITMSWEANNDMDLWLKLPNGQRVGYPNRDIPPAHLDIDVVSWRTYDPEGRTPIYDEGFSEWDETYEPPEGHYLIKKNEEVITIRGIVVGHYVVNVHYFNARKHQEPVRVSILVQDVKHQRIIYAGEKCIANPRDEVFFVSFNVERQNDLFTVSDINSENPEYFLK